MIFIVYHVYWKDGDTGRKNGKTSGGTKKDDQSFLSHGQPAQQVDYGIENIINHRIKETLQRARYHAEYTLRSNTVASFTKDKKDIYLCSSCVDKDKTDLEKLTYVGLHEVSHVICKSKDHTEEWRKIFKELLHAAADLGYLQKSRIKG